MARDSSGSESVEIVRVVRQTRSVVSHPMGGDARPLGSKGGNGGLSAFEDKEALAALDDDVFRAAVNRMLATQRKIYNTQANHWSTVRLRENKRATEREARMLRATLASTATEEVDRARDRCRGAPLGSSSRSGATLPHVSRGGAHGANDGRPVVSVTVKRPASALNATATEERQQIKAVLLPPVQNVPRYTSYIASAYENSHVRDEVRRRLLFPDHEGEMQMASDDDVLVDSDDNDKSSSDSDTNDDSKSPGSKAAAARASPHYQQGQGKPGSRTTKEAAERAEHNGKQRDKKAKRLSLRKTRTEAAEKARDEAATMHWDTQDDYLIFVASVTLDTSPRAITAVAANLKLDSAVLRARMKVLTRELEHIPQESIGSYKPALSNIYSDCLALACKGKNLGKVAAEEFETALRAASGQDPAGRERATEAEIVGLKSSADGTSHAMEDDEDPFKFVPKTEPDDKEEELSAEEEEDKEEKNIKRRGRGQGPRPTDPRGRRRADSSLSGLWNLVAWRFLTMGDAPKKFDVDIPDAIVDDTDMEHVYSEMERAHYDCVQPAMDSFRTLYCVRCHAYDCNLHGCGQEQPPRIKAPVGGRWGAQAAAAKAVEAAEVAGVETEAVCPCGPECWRLRRSLVKAVTGNVYAASSSSAGEWSTALFDVAAIKAAALKATVDPKNANKRARHAIGKEKHSEGNESFGEGEAGRCGTKGTDLSPSEDVTSKGGKKAVKRKPWYLFEKAAAVDTDAAAENAAEDASDASEDTRGEYKSPARAEEAGKGHSEQFETANEDEDDDNDEVGTRDRTSIVAAERELLRWRNPDKFWGDWSQFHESFYEKMRTVYGKSEDPCAIARAISGPSCVNVCRRLLHDLREDVVMEAITGANTGGKDYDQAGGGRGGLGRGGRGGRGGRRKVSKFHSTRKRTTATIRRRMANSEDHMWTQYTPCTCEGGCNTKTCTCMRDGNFCERWCACGGTCDNRFGGCNCKAGTCRTRACPCFAAARECNPDVCRRCTVTAARHAHQCREGSGAFGELCVPINNPTPPVNLDAPTDPNNELECMNMRLLLRQHKHICLGLSAVAGWGAFLKDGAKKNELLGEYTGELISQAEADRRGRIYDRLNCSFLFNLNDQWVLDAYLKGNKLKFANHSATPNCYAKVLMVRGDHRVGIFAKEDIAPGEELTYDYRYERDKAPSWAVSEEPAPPLFM